MAASRQRRQVIYGRVGAVRRSLRDRLYVTHRFTARAVSPKASCSARVSDADSVGYRRATVRMIRSPITPNQALERTADRREDLLSMTSTLELEARVGLVSG